MTTDTLDLADLEKETTEILERYGKSSKASSRSLRTLSTQSRANSARSPLQASAFNRSFKQSAAAYEGSKKKTIRPFSTSDMKPTTMIDEDLRLSKADGSSTNNLCNTISDALTSSKFDSVPSLLDSTQDSMMNNNDRLMSPYRGKSQSMMSGMGGPKRQSMNRTSSSKTLPNTTSSLSIREVNFGPSIDSSDAKPKTNSGTNVDDKEVCFNCWSAGESRKCQIHAKKASESIAGQNLSCSNWDTGYLRRKYRAEELQEVYNQQSESLVANKHQQQISTAVTAKHPIYRLVDQHISQLNFIYSRRQNTKLWLQSFIHKLKEGSFQNNRSAQSAKILCLKGTLNNMQQVEKLTKDMFDKLPKAPVTGTTMREKLGQDQVLVERLVNVDGVEKTCKFVLVGPTPVPKELYRPRKYKPSSPTKFVLQSDSHVSVDENAHANNNELELTSLLQDANSFVEYATFTRKGTNNNMAVGGLPTEMLVSKRFKRCFPPQYKDITISDDNIILPPQQVLRSTPPTLEVPPHELKYVRRQLVTPLDNRRPPTVMTKVGIDRDERHYFGLNRVEQTGDEEDFGFRTSTYYELPERNYRIDPRTFTPSESIATPPALAVTPFRTMITDESYPFCRETSRTNCVDDLYPLLLSNGQCHSSNKLQVFTSVGKQHNGYFMQNADSTLPIGRLVTKVIRTWAFLQDEPEKGKDPYNNPPAERIYREETTALGLGGVLFNNRPRYQGLISSETKTTLYSDSRTNVRSAILDLSTDDVSKIKGKLFDDRPLLQGLLDDIAEKRVGKQHVEYLPVDLNLPAPQCADTFKPKTSLETWADRQDYNPWIDGKPPRSTHFVRSLAQETKKWPRVNHNKEDVETNTDKEFAALCSLVRHGKYRDLEDTLNNPEWSLPIDYCNESGNTLLMIACQNGNRRIVKLCLRRGSKINKRNLNGNTCLHFCFGYGFGKCTYYFQMPTNTRL